MFRCARCPKFIEVGVKIGRFTYCGDCAIEINVIDPIIYQTALELGYRAGEQVRDDMRKAGMSEAQIKDVVEKAFDWRRKKRLEDFGS